MKSEKVSEMIKNIEKRTYLIKSGKESVYCDVLEGNYEKARTTALEVQKKELELTRFVERTYWLN